MLPLKTILVLFAVPFVVASLYEANVREVQVFSPRGVRICISQSGASKAMFRGFTNKNVIVNNAVPETNNGIAIEDPDISLKQGDVLHYTIGAIDNEERNPIHGKVIVKNILSGQMADHSCHESTLNRQKRHMYIQHYPHHHYPHNFPLHNGHTKSCGHAEHWGNQNPWVHNHHKVTHGNPTFNPYNPYNPTDVWGPPEVTGNEGFGFYPPPMEPDLKVNTDREEVTEPAIEKNPPEKLKTSTPAVATTTTTEPYIDIRFDDDQNSTATQST